MMTALLRWYSRRWATTWVGTILATAHLLFTIAVIVMVAVSPSRDWPWWPILPFLLDFPFSVVINLLGDCAKYLAMLLPHAGMERWLLGQREPFCSFDLFWIPAILFPVLGTLWHYFWPQLPGYLTRKWENRRGQKT